MILTKSPYYLTIPWNHPTEVGVPEKYILELYIWNGVKDLVPFVTYEIENKNPLERNGSVDVNISNYINTVLNTSLESDTTTNLIDANSAVWVKSQVIYYIDGVAQSPEYISTDLAIKGYGYGIDGKNTTTPSNNVLTSSKTSYFSLNSSFNIPIKVDESSSVGVTVISYPDNKINKSFTINATNNSSQLTQNIFVKCSEIDTDTSIQVRKDNVLIKELILKEEFRYSPIDIWFINKYGHLDTITFFKDKVDSLKVKSESYETNIGQPKDGIHQFENFNTNGQTEFKIYSGFVKESNNEIFKQLFLSAKVWQFDGTTFIPLNLGSTNLEYQTRQRDRLINYEVSFKYSFSEINNI